MGERRENLEGRTFGRLTVTGQFEVRVSGSYKRVYWLCQCACGASKWVPAASLRRPSPRGTVSCGCRIGSSARTHGMYGTPEHSTWKHMLERCHNKNHAQYEDYGGRGITIDPRWLKFENFLEDMGLRPQTPPGYRRYYSLERKKNHLGYSKDNCEWAPPNKQQRNKRNNHTLTLNGETRTITEWAERSGVGRTTISWRLDQGLSLEEALKPVKK